MPNSDTWPRTVSVETLSNMDSARSCDSVISVNSACSEDSMEHLSAEEKACLMYLEETIESLDLQEDSGFSNDEPDPAIRRSKHRGAETLSQPENIVMEGGGPSGANAPAFETENPTSQSSQTSSSSSTPDISDPDLPSHIPPDPSSAVPQSNSGRATPVPGQDTAEPSVCSDGDSQGAVAKSDMDLSMIPPPSDFMDEPVSPPASKDSDNSSVTSPSTPKSTINLEVLRRRVSEKNIPANNLSTSLNSSPTSSSPVNPTPANSAPTASVSVVPSPTSPTIVEPAPVEPNAVTPPHLIQPPPSSLQHPAPSSHPSSPTTEAPSVAIEHKSPPTVAPKPKKLPPNIILKSHKSTGQDSLMGHLSPSDRLRMDPQKVRMEALRKLGLLKSEESHSGPVISPKNLQARKSWAPSSSPLSPTPLIAAPPSAPYTTNVPHFTEGPIASPTHVPSEPLPDIIPVPAAFCDPVVPSHDDVFVVLSDQSSPVLDKKLLSSPSRGSVKSATLERSGLGLSSYMESVDKQQQSLTELRNSRPRPASLGSRKDFEVGKKIVPAPSSSADSSQKLPCSQGISVLISPGERSEESRRKALKKLGLLRD